MPCLPTVILLYALIVDCRTCDCYPTSVLAAQSCGDFESIWTIALSFDGCYLCYHWLFFTDSDFQSNKTWVN